MTVLSRGARGRRSGRRPGWLLLTVLLVLAIAASSALVFTDRVELLKLAVILALWAAVVAAFVSVIYRRQSDADQAKVRDLKLVYDLQLDREISARREYELTVETQLRRELATEFRAQSADEVAALRAELAALRTNLEILFDTDLGHRPAIETDRTTVHAYSDWARDSETTGRVSSSRIDAEYDDADDMDVRTEESPIIDVPAEPQPADAEWLAPDGFGGAHRRPSEESERETPRGRRHRVDDPAAGRVPDQPAWVSAHDQPVEPERPDAAPQTPSSGWQPAPAEGQWIPAGAPGSNWVAPTGENGSSAEYVGRRRAPEQEAQYAEYSAAPDGDDEIPATDADQPASDQGPELEAETEPEPRDDEAAEDAEGDVDVEEAGDVDVEADVEEDTDVDVDKSEAEDAEDDVDVEDDTDVDVEKAADLDVEKAADLDVEEADVEKSDDVDVEDDTEEVDDEEARHRTADEGEDADGQHTGGYSVAELLARLQATPTGGGRRRRRDE